MADSDNSVTFGLLLGKDLRQAIDTLLRVDKEFDLPALVRRQRDSTAATNANQLEDALKTLHAVSDTRRPPPIILCKDGRAGYDETDDEIEK